MKNANFMVTASAICLAIVAGCAIIPPKQGENSESVQNVLKKPIEKLSKNDRAILAKHAVSNIVEIIGMDIGTSRWESAFLDYDGYIGCHIQTGMSKWECFLTNNCEDYFTNFQSFDNIVYFTNEEGQKTEYWISYVTNSVQCIHFANLDIKKQESYKYDDCSPRYTKSAEDAVAKAKVIAKTCLGIDDFGDAGKWRVYYINAAGDLGSISISANKIINGYPSDCSVSVSYYDAPATIVKSFGNDCIYYDTDNLPTNAVVSKGEAKSLADVYIRKYYDDQELVPGMQFTTNRLEYVRPNYYYIHPGNFGGLKKRPLYPPRLAWLCEYKKPDHYPNGLPNSYHAFPLVIFVDAENGEMLGGHD